MARDDGQLTERIERVSRMEAILDAHAALLVRLGDAIDAFEAGQADYQLLRDYYCSEDYLADVDVDAAGGLPDDLKRGVLSEDATFELIGDNLQAAIRMLEVATAVVRDH